MVPLSEVLTASGSGLVEPCTARVRCPPTAVTEDGDHTKTELPLACDGIQSAVRRSPCLQWRERFAGYTCWRGIVQQRPDDVEPGHMTESWGKGRRFGVVPKAGKCTGSHAQARRYPMIGRSQQWGCLSFANVFRIPSIGTRDPECLIRR